MNSQNKLNPSSAAASGLLIAIAIGLHGVLCFSAQQQGKASQAPEPPQDRFEYMSRELALTPEQKPKVKAIVDAQMGEWDTLEKNKTLNGKEKIARMQEINRTAEAKIEKLLTEPQKKKLTAIMEAGKPHPGKPAPNRKPKIAPGPREE